MNLNEAFSYIQTELKKGDIPSSKRETRLIFQHILGISKEEFFINPSRILTNNEKGKAKKTIERRKSGFPLQYILGEWEFYGLPFLVGEGVLIPRQDTELLIDNIIKETQGIKNLNIIDLCSGTGCIGIALAKNLPNAKVTLVEYSKEAFFYLIKNIKKNNVKNVKPILGDVLNRDCANGFFESFDIIVSNPPYIETSYLSQLQKEVSFEPVVALDGGEDGMKFYSNITKLWKENLKDTGAFFYEIGINQEVEVDKIFKENGFLDIKTCSDFNNIPRIIWAKNRSMLKKD